ncbi:MAG: hypothetical protein ACLGGV_06045 [Bacteroidia bacterium]
MSCNHDAQDNDFFSLKQVEVVDIIESESIYIKSVNNPVLDEKQEFIYFISDGQQVLKVNLDNGRLYSVFNPTDSLLVSLYKKTQLHYSNLNFVADYNELIKDDLRLKIDRVVISSEEAYITLTIFTNYLGRYNNQDAAITSFFPFLYRISAQPKDFVVHINHKIDYSNVKINDDLSTEGVDLINLQGGFYIKDSIMFAKNIFSPVSPSSKLLYRVVLSENSQVIKADSLLDYHTNPKLHRREDVIINSYFFHQFDDNIYFTEGKNIYLIDDNKKDSVNILKEKYFHISSFSFLNSVSILCNIKSDTSNVKKTIVYNKKENKKTLIKEHEKNVLSVLFGHDKMYEIIKEEDAYKIVKYHINRN